MSLVKLKNAPLKEVIFELHWNCEVDNQNLSFDNGFDLAQGKFAEKLKENFPLHRKLIPDAIPFKIFGAPLHQYWAGELKWPVVQHGQGMIAINEVEQGYEWLKYKDLILNTIKKLVGSYEDKLNFSKVKLQYVDVFDLEGEEAKDFMAKNLQTEIITKYPLPGTLKGFNIQQQFNLADASTMELNISNGINNQNQKESVVWNTIIAKQDSLDVEQLNNWIESAHTVASDFFKIMLKPSFYASLDK